PLMDFAAMRREIGVPEGCGLLEAIAAMTPPDRLSAETILHRHEESAATQSTLNPGCDELIAWVRGQRLATALITRNSRASAACAAVAAQLRYRTASTLRVDRDAGVASTRRREHHAKYCCDRIGFGVRGRVRIGAVGAVGDVCAGDGYEAAHRRFANRCRPGCLGRARQATEGLHRQRHAHRYRLGDGERFDDDRADRDAAPGRRRRAAARDV